MQENIQMVNQVLKTYDYNMFKFMEGNRNVNPLHLSRVTASLLKKQLEIPIVVTENMEIFEGQHRFVACQMQKLPVFYIVLKGLTLEDAITINSVSRKWSAEDYFHHYLAQGKEQYRLLASFMSVTGLSLHNARTFLSSVSAKGLSGRMAFVNGEFMIEDYPKALDLFSEHMDYKKCPAFSRANCKLAILKVLNTDGYDHNRMKDKLEQVGYKLTNRASVTDYLTILSEIYNYNAKKGTLLYFHLDQN